MKDYDPKAFAPYKRFVSNLEAVDEFEELSGISFGLTQHLLFRFPKEDVKSFKPPLPEREELSFCIADQEVDSVELSCEWITLPECAKRSGTELPLVQEQASSGNLGPVQNHPKTSEKVVVWPPEKRSLPPEKLPEPGKKTFSVKLSVKASAPLGVDVDDMTQFERTQKTFLRLAHSMGKPEQVADKAQEILYRSCFLLRWTVFEVFLRSSVHALFRMHPQVLATGNRAKKASVSFADVVDLSREFTSLDSLQQALVEREIEHSEAEGQSVHGLISLLKGSFRFDTDPYKAWYVIRGERHETDYNTLLEVKEVRNALVHDGGQVDGDFMQRFPNVPYRDKEVIVDDTYHLKTHLVLRSIAYRIADTVVRGKYTIGGSREAKTANKAMDSDKK